MSLTSEAIRAIGLGAGEPLRRLSQSGVLCGVVVFFDALRSISGKVLEDIDNTNNADVPLSENVDIVLLDEIATSVLVKHFFPSPFKRVQPLCLEQLVFRFQPTPSL